MKEKKCVFKIIGVIVSIGAAVATVVVFRKEICNFFITVKDKAWELIQKCKCVFCKDDCDTCSCCEDCGCDCCEDDYEDAELVAEADYVEEEAEEAPAAE